MIIQLLVLSILFLLIRFLGLRGFSLELLSIFLLVFFVLSLLGLNLFPGLEVGFRGIRSPINGYRIDDLGYNNVDIRSHIVDTNVFVELFLLGESLRPSNVTIGVVRLLTSGVRNGENHVVGGSHTVHLSVDASFSNVSNSFFECT